MFPEKLDFPVKQTWIPGAQYVRQSLARYLQYLFSKFSILSNYKWGENRNETKIHIYSEYPEVSVVYPEIIVITSGYRYEPVGFKEHLGVRNTGEIGYYGGRNVFDSIGIKARALKQDEVEEIIDLCRICLSINPIRERFTQQTNIYLLIDRISTSAVAKIPLQNIEGKYQFEQTITFSGSSEWFIEVDPIEVETIASEIVTSK